MPYVPNMTLVGGFYRPAASKIGPKFPSHLLPPKNQQHFLPFCLRWLKKTTGFSPNGGLIGDLPWVESVKNQHQTNIQAFPPQILVPQNQSPWFQGVILTETPGAFLKTSCLSNKTQSDGETNIMKRCMTP